MDLTSLFARHPWGQSFIDYPARSNWHHDAFLTAFDDETDVEAFDDETIARYVTKMKKQRAPPVFESWPSALKLFIYTWCSLIMGFVCVFLLDQITVRLAGPEKVVWGPITHAFPESVTRDNVWDLVVNAPKWTRDHPVLQEMEIVGVPLPLVGGAEFQ